MSTVYIDSVVEEITSMTEAGTHDDRERERLAALWKVLDGHMSNGGALPAKWRTKSPCHI